MNATQNPNCDGNKCKSENGEVRVLILGRKHTLCGAILVCEACYHEEISWRKERNKQLAEDAKFDLPAWEKLEIY